MRRASSSCGTISIERAAHQPLVHFAFVRSLLLCALLLVSGRTTFAAGPFLRPVNTEVVLLKVEGGDTASAVAPHANRVLAAALAITLGPFGGHRIYLGTDAKVPLIYGLTFGGFGVLAVIDLVQILFTKDLSVYRNNYQVFMWARPRKETATPP